MLTRKLELACPVCASTEVFYTCTPNCCFNHVCNGCGSTFEPATISTGRVRTGLQAPDPMPEAADPTVACARCDNTSVYAAEDGELVCLACGMVLTLEINDIAANGD